MSRIEEALKRAQLGINVPESINVPSAKALDRFPAGLDERSDSSDGFVHSAEPHPPIDPLAAPARARTPAPSPGDPAVAAVFRRFSSAVDEKLVVGGDIRPISLEQYRRLAATLHHAQTDRGIKVVMVASAMPGEGKTLTAMNLALTLSESYRRRVLLIDADLRRPTMHDLFQVPNVSGLNDGLKAEAERKLSLVEISPRLSVLPAGRPDPDPMSGLTSDRMRRVIQEASAKFDWVILDTPPVGLLPDANLLAAMVDVSVLVIRAGTTPHALIQRAVGALGRDEIIGVVLNRVDESVVSASDEYHHYYGYAGKS